MTTGWPPTALLNLREGVMEQTQPMTRPRTRGRVIVLLSIALIAFVVYACFGVLKAREAARHTACKGRLGKLQLALLNYHEVHGSFPPAYVADADGRPMHSWRVLILPYLGGEVEYKHYRFDEPWSSPHNIKIARSGVSALFRCPSNPQGELAPQTDYVLIVGKDTAFPGATTTKLTDILDGAENTILVAELNNSDIYWMEPRDLDAGTMSFLVNDPGRRSISAPHEIGPAVVFADRITAYRLSPSISPNTLKALTTIAGNEPVSKKKLILDNGQLGN
jgi:hypothetical protein